MGHSANHSQLIDGAVKSTAMLSATFSFGVTNKKGLACVDRVDLRA